MKPQEVWHKWLPDTQSLAEKYIVTAIEDIIGGFNIYLYDERSQKKTCVNFYKSTFIFRKTNISYRSAELERISSEQREIFFNEWSFFKIVNSEYLHELVEESYGMLNSKYCIHFVVVGSNCIIDVITGYEPKILLLD